MLGSDYLFACLGEHMLGIYSLSTGQLVSEISLSTGSLSHKECRLLCLEIFEATGHNGKSKTMLQSPHALLSWNLLLAATFTAPKSCVHIFKVR